jgi:predicted CoA-substrate-specific enzyme activase
MPVEAVRQGLKEIDRLWGHRLEIHGVGTTGSGRELIAEFIGADVVHDEITAHKTGAFHISRLLGGEPVDTIFEIGGQDAKFISMDNGVVTDFAMNDACAAGTGSFLEEQADMLGISIRDEFAKLALTAPAPARLGEFCTVATGNTLNARIQTGETMPNLLAGLACAVARNYVNLVVRRRPIGKVIYFQGGTASNRAVAAAFAGLLGRKIIVPPHNRVIGAIGVALIALEWSRTTGENTRFRGYRLAELHGNVRNFVCQACNNQCDVKEFTIEGNKSYWGGKCSDRYSQPAFSGRRPVIRDLIAYREELFDEITAGGVEGGRFRIGLPRALTHFDLYPFWHCYISQLGMQVVLSPASDPKITENVFEIIAAPFCLPIRVALGHVRALTETEVDHILLPSIDRTEITGEDDAQSCLWTRTLPHALACSAALEPHKDKLLIPTISFREGPEQVKDALYAVMAGLGVSRNDNDRAVDEAYAAQKAFQNKLLAAGRTALEQLAETGEPGLVLAGRSYNLYDRTINCDVPRKLRARYGANVIPFDFLAMGHERDGSFRENLPWEAGKRILATAELTATWDNLHLIQTSHFSCVPDAGTRRIARQTAGRPLLFLQFDGHGWDAGYMTRCEAFLDSKGILRCYTAAAAPEEVAAPC